LGIRYDTPFGPIRVDIATPVRGGGVGEDIFPLHRHRAGILMRRLILAATFLAILTHPLTRRTTTGSPDPVPRIAAVGW
jgi:hypothetical protein